jgi:hypothetical protein
VTGRSWGLIRSGPTFERLVTTLLFFEDPEARLFGRRGKDGGQDARSGDRKTVYQAKHHERPTAAKALTDARKEAKKIAKYQKKEPQKSLWAGVENWVLATNASFNPADEQRWADEIVPLYAQLGLTADYWEEATLDALLARYPAVDACFFDSRPSVFLSVPQMLERLEVDAPFLPRAVSRSVVGREVELGTATEFLDLEESFLLLSGAGGVGKTRFLAEFGERTASTGDWDVYWANIETMIEAGRWFDAIVPERPTLILVDEPDDERLLKQLAEQTAQHSGRAGHWKIAVAVRTPKDPVVRFMTGAQMKRRVRTIELPSLAEKDAAGLAEDLIASGPLGEEPEEWRQQSAKQIARSFDRHPIWMALAVHLLEQDGDLSKLPTTAEDLARSYVREIAEQASETDPKVVRDLLRWIALFRVFNRRDAALLSEVTRRLQMSEETLLAELARLVKRKAMRQRGAYDRLVEVKPDVIRDYILREWLVIDTGFGPTPYQRSKAASDLADELLDSLISGELKPASTATLGALASIQWRLRMSGEEIDLLGPITSSLEANLSQMSARNREGLSDLFVGIAQLEPDGVLALSAAQRRVPCEPEEVEGLLGVSVTDHDDVLLSLAWPVFHAVMGALTDEQKEACLRELYSLCAVEEEVRGRRAQTGLPNDGKRATDLLQRAVGGGPQFFGELDSALQKLTVAELEFAGEQNSLTPSRTAALVRLCKVASEASRQATWFADASFHIQRYAPTPGSLAWATRRAVIEKVEVLLNTVDAEDVRVTLWTILANAKRGLAVMAARVDDDAGGKLSAESVEILEFTRECFRSRTPSPRELRAAREMWSWYLEFDPDSLCGRIAQELEEIFSQNDVAELYESILGSVSDERRDKAAEVAVQRLGTAQSPEEISQFIEGARTYTGDEGRVWGLSRVARGLGAAASDDSAIVAFIQTTLGQDGVNPLFRQFAVEAAAAWVRSERQPDRSGAAAALEMVLQASLPSGRADLLQALYGGLGPPRDAAEMTDEEYEILWGSLEHFRAANRTWAFLDVIGWTFLRDWGRMKREAEDVLSSPESGDFGLAVQALIQSAYWGARQLKEAGEAAPPDLGPWVFGYCIQVPDVSSLGGNTGWYLGELLRITSSPDPETVVEGLERRAQVASASLEDGTRYSGLGSRPRLTSYVDAPKPDDPGTVAASAAERALALIGDGTDVGYHLPEILRDLDPHMRWTPGLVASAVTNAEDIETVRRFSRIGRAFSPNSDPWRTIAIACVEAARALDPGALGSIYYALTDPGIRTFSKSLGEVPALFEDAVKSARRRLDEERDAGLKGLWSWQLARAEADLERKTEEAKEDLRNE